MHLLHKIGFGGNVLMKCSLGQETGRQQRKVKVMGGGEIDHSLRHTHTYTYTHTHTHTQASKGGVSFLRDFGKHRPAHVILKH